MKGFLALFAMILATMVGAGETGARAAAVGLWPTVGPGKGGAFAFRQHEAVTGVLIRIAPRMGLGEIRDEGRSYSLFAQRLTEELPATCL